MRSVSPSLLVRHAFVLPRVMSNNHRHLVALVLLIFAMTQGSSSGWGTGGVIAPLIISIFMIAGFFFYETLIPTDMAAM